MHTIPSPLHLGAVGPEVANLQEILMWLINNGTITIGSDEIVNTLADEHIRQVFGSATVDAVRLYQNVKNLDFSTPVLGWPTVNSINAAIGGFNESQPVLVTGTLRNPAGDAVPAIYQIKLFQASINGIAEGALPWMETLSDTNGKYSFVVGNVDEHAAELRGYQIRAVNTITGVSYRSLTTYLSGPVRYLDVVVSDADAMPGYEYDIVRDETLAALAAIGSPAISSIDTDSSDAKQYLEAATSESFDKIRSLVNATRLSGKIADFDPGFLYALSRFNISSDPDVLFTVPDESLKKAAIAAMSNNIIPSADAAALTAKVSALRSALLNRIRQAGTATGEAASPQNSATFRIFNKILNNPERTSRFIKRYFEHESGAGASFWDSLGAPGPGGEQSEFTPVMIADLKLAAVLAMIAGNNAAVVFRLFKMLKAEPLGGDPAIPGASASSPRPALLAGLSVPQWYTILTNALNQDAANFFFPDYVTGNDPTTKKESYAAFLDDISDRIFPTNAISRDIAAAAETPFTELKTGMNSFIANNPGFDLRTVPYVTLTEGDFTFSGVSNVPAFVEEIGTVQRLMNLTPDSGQIAAMADKGYTSSMKIARQSFESFSSDLDASMSTEDAQTIYSAANSIAATAMANAFEQFAELDNARGGPQVTDWTATIPEEAYAEWRALFGSVDGCNCSECQSVYSPSAYLTDTMHFMETKIWDNAVFSELADRRRPDLRHIKLTCKNANTPVPQIDIINEVLEDLVSHKHHNAGTANPEYLFYARQTNAPAAQQRAIPEHVNYGNVKLEAWNGTAYTPTATVKAPYPVLQAAVYPWSLPYNFYKRQIDTYLGLPGIKGHELMQRFGTKNRLEAWDDIAFCTEYLGISKEQMQHITTPVLLAAPGYFALAPFYGLKLSPSGTTILNIPDPANRGSDISVSASTWITATIGGRVDVFLQQTGLSYSELLQLADCYCINPIIANTTTRKFRIAPIPPADDATCQLDQLYLPGLDMFALQLLYRFVQMSRALGWSFYELDRAFRALGIFPGTTTQSFTGFTAADFKKLVQLKHIVSVSGLSVEQACLLFADIEELPYRDYTKSEPVDIPNQYERIFRNPLVFDVADTAFPFYATAGSSVPVAREVLINYLSGVLGISQQELRDLPAGTISPAATVTPSLSVLSTIYREALLVKLSGYKVGAWTSMKRWFSDPAWFGTGGTTPYDQRLNFSSFTTYEAIRLLEFSRSQQETGLTPESIDFLLRDALPDTVTDDKNNEAMAAELTALHKELTKRWPGANYNAATDSDGSGLTALLELVTDGEKAKLLTAIVQDGLRVDPDYSQSRVQDFINKDMKFFLKETGTDLRLIVGLGSGATTPQLITTDALRRAYVYAQLSAYISEQVLKPTVISAMARYFKTDEKLTAAVLDLIRFPGHSITGLEELASIVKLTGVTFKRWAMSSVPSDRSFETLVQLDKAMRLIQTFRLSAKEIAYLWQPSPLLPDSTRLMDLPFRSASNAAVTAAPYRNLYTFFRWMQVRDFVAEKSLDLFAAIRETYTPAPAGPISKTDFLERLRLVFKTNKADLEVLLGGSTGPANGLLGAAFSAGYLNPDLYLRIRDTLEMQFLLPASMDTLAKIAAAIYSAQTQSDANEIIHVVKAQYDAETWLEAVRPVSDKLRIERRDAMVAYLLANPPHPYEKEWFTSNDIFETLLIDVEMSPCMPTTRTLLAINSTQLWMDRVMMGLEENTGVSPEQPLKIDKESGRQWASWRKRYRIWEANRKIFIYPENWIEPELRDDKTPLFIELEKFLKQNEVTKENVELAYSTYLERLDELAHLEVIAMYRETHQTDYTFFMYNPADIEPDVIHVFARTPAHPHIYYYRKRVREEWTAWSRMEVQIDGDHFVPVMWRGRLRLYWLTFMKEQQTDAGSKMRSDEKFVTPPPTRYKINLAWTELKNGNWTAKQVSRDALYSFGIEEEDLVNKAQLDFFLDRGYKNKEVRSWYPAGTMDRQLRERFYFYSTFDDRGNLQFDVQEKIVRTSTDSLNKRTYNVAVWGLTSITTDAELPARLRHLDSSEQYNDVFRSGRGSFCVMFNDVKASPKFNSSANLYQPFHYSGAKDANSLEVNHYAGWYSDYRYMLDANSGYYHFPNRVKLLDWAPDTENGKARGKYLVFPKEVPAGYNDPRQRIRIPYFFYKDNDNSFFVEEVHVATAGTPITLPDGLDNGDTISIDPGWGVNLGGGGKGGGLFGDPIGAPVPVPVGGGGLGGGITVPVVSLPGYRVYYRFHSFFHNRVDDFRQKLFESGIDGLLDRNFIQSLNANDDMDFYGTYAPTTDVMVQDLNKRPVYPTNSVDFEYDAAFSTYNWELFYHIPILIANKLSLNQQFSDARAWYHYVFNPTVANNLSTPVSILDFWNFEPFYKRAYKVPTILQVMQNQNLQNAVNRWANDPFKPHLVARTRITAYMKSTVMKYLDNLIAWGDALFRTDSREDIVEATLLYVLAAQMLGRRPVQIPPRATPAVHTYASLQANASWDAFNNALVKVESYLLSSGVKAPATNAAANSLPVYLFCIPPNSKLNSYWDIIADRLFKIRNCQNIDGVTRDLALYDPPIDPALLVKAAAAGISASEAVAAANAPLPLYRFQVLAQKATEIAGEVKALGSQLLSALEKKDAEKLGLLRSSQELRVLEAVTELREKSIEDAISQINGLDLQRRTVTERRKYYQGLIDGGLNSEEQLQLASMQGTIPLQVLQGSTMALASIANIWPNITLGVFSAGATVGGSQLAAVSSAVAAAAGAHSGVLSTIGSMAATKGSFKRRAQEWEFQVKTADGELLQLDKQVISAQIRKAMAEVELKNHRLQMENALSMDEAMRGKYTNEELYDWMIGQISFTYMSAYKLALSMAMKAERCYQNELNLASSDFITATYWDSLHKGLMAGETLAYDIKRMEASYLDKNKRQLELSKHISLAALNPDALLKLKSGKPCTITIPEWIYDMDYPGHHMRRIKSVSISIPCVAGPYTTVSCKLSLLKSRYRISGISSGQSNYNENPLGNDPRFRYVYGNIQSIATSHGQNDSGMFDFSFRDERYLPFEGAGAISEWRIALPAAYAQFDYDSISDVILHINYTALDEGGLATDASWNATQMLENAAKDGFNSLFDLKHEFSDAWYAYGASYANTPLPLKLRLNGDMYPMFSRGRQINVKPQRFLGKWKAPAAAAGQTIELSYWNGNSSSKAVYSITGTVNGYTTFTNLSGPQVLIDGNTRILKVRLMDGQTAKNMDEVFEELYMMSLNHLVANAAITPTASDPDWSDAQTLPTLPSGAAAWWMADAGIVRNQSTGNVMTWLDQTLSGNSLQRGSQVQEPLYFENGGPNGKAYLSFTGSHMMSCTGFSLPATPTLTVFAVYRSTSDTNVGLLAETSANFQWYPGAIALATNDGYSNHIATSHFGNAGLAVGGTTIPLNQWSHVRFTDDFNTMPPNEATTSVNGGAPANMSRWVGNTANNSGNFSTSHPLYVGSRANQAFGLKGDVAEIIFYSRALTAPEIAIVENYLKSKYNL